MKKNHFKSLFILMIAFLLTLGTLPSARADEPTPPPLPRPPIQVANVVLLGDSYSAGNGAGEYDTAAPGHYRSRNNWASHYVDWLSSKNRSILATRTSQSREQRQAWLLMNKSRGKRNPCLWMQT